MLAALVALPAGAFPSARLVYVRGQGAEHCPNEMELRLSVAHRLGYDPFNTGSRRTIMAVLEGDEEKIAARLELVDEQGVSQGERRLEAASDRCSDLVRALALSMSIAIDPERAVPDGEAPSTWRFRKPPANEPPSHDRSDEKRSKPSSAPLVLRFGLGGQAALGAAPAPVAGALVVGSPRYRSFSLGLEFRMDAVGSRVLANGASIQSQLFAGSAAPCLHYDPALVCAVGTWGVVEATSDAARPLEDTGFYGAAGLRIGTEWPLAAALLLRTHADLLATLTPVRIRLDGQRVWEMSGVTGSLGATLLARFP
jgi:hypothetical protein